MGSKGLSLLCCCRPLRPQPSFFLGVHTDRHNDEHTAFCASWFAPALEHQRRHGPARALGRAHCRAQTVKQSRIVLSNQPQEWCSPVQLGARSYFPFSKCSSKLLRQVAFEGHTESLIKKKKKAGSHTSIIRSGACSQPGILRAILKIFWA